MDGYIQLEGPDDVELRSLSRPLFDADGQVTFVLTMWGRRDRLMTWDVRIRSEALCANAAAATQALADR